MSNLVKNQSGFGIVGIVLIVLAVGLIGATGWYVLKNNHESTKNNAATQNDAPEQTELLPDPTEEGKYLVIREWGVRFPLPEDLRGDIYYRIDKNGILNAEFTSFASNKLDELVGDNSCTFKENPQNNGLSARLIRGLPDQLSKNPDYVKEGWEPIKGIDTYEYYLPKEVNDPPITCLTNGHEEFNDVEYSISKQLRQAFESLEPVEL